MDKYQAIQEFINLAEKNHRIETLDKIYWRNQLLHFLGMNDWDEPQVTEEHEPLILMDQLMTLARENHAFPPEEEEFYEAALMDFISPTPSQINREFWQNYQESPKKATDYFYGLTQEINQVKTRDIAKNIAFNHHSKYGDLEITINLSKPEKDPKAIAAAKLIKDSSYPACALCIENEGLYGGGNKAARSNHRLIRLKLHDEEWGFQYSPYAYYNEHSIVLNNVHKPMKINRRSFSNLLEFLDLFPHYMIGSNADLPIVGGSILTHDHYQAGRHEFPMAKAKLREQVVFKNFPEVAVGIVNWPMSVLRLSSEDKGQLLTLADFILKKWQQYSDTSIDLLAHSADGTPHHTITPIARKRDDAYEMDLVLRDNNVSDTYPDGIFHPHADLHHIKKENIGLIEVMGLAVLPPRLKDELQEVEQYLLGKPHHMKEMHLPWAQELKNQGNFTEENVSEYVREAVGAVFTRVLQDAGVFKDNEAGHAGFKRFIDFINE
ncbi:UDP-glucose--hexose-1-phosphate uridylyltransferase [Lactococcus garvieae]|jgi:UDPglucose--hexose-1-phosphate uridylyltransferase|uniref:UDP-glucose--hexose-1-phosphate uridylyltransferase n=1 Tax=Lactococcus garvieae TaxID=1363 RepID=UPI000266D5BA|nr:UDP-glucose--hexose-1-phosphate uridylyltransferase [Lactococcus garvieae]MDN5628189.1 UDP-glucose--hexose-1-phosphate uridylyltransferase [Lactococcus sp.]EIT67333.1 Galactose-1-phosphate uridylyltransferase [Lactococcus garvieae IPLA 31405]MBS4463849.1 UDP-glucose--hexose-1-phosphate uridylyltransferase [Lactococcus garvieae]MCO7129640.1 UDP-glucose--hexose-1-phosphate uridylyltransferase [Lactococcus garvieae]MDB7635285.1 UDP-glucose--hexose-1-phosphate uridylyltransferase [Lactococcus g